MSAKNVNPTAQPSDACPIAVGDDPLTVEALERCWGRPLQVAVGDGAWERIRRSRSVVERLAREAPAVYGINTGFGRLCTTRIEADQLERLQENLVISHAVGVGPAVPDDLVRWMMLFKLQALAQGFSGIHAETAKLLAELLSADLLPVVPTQGSLGASGDLAPLAHMALPLIGRGTVRRNGTMIAAAEALSGAGLEAIQLGAKEGLALINGTQFMSAYAAGLVVRARHLVKHADIVATMSLDALQGSVKPFAEELHRLRPHRGAIETAGNVRKLMRDSAILASHAGCGKVQDPYSLRCVPQVHGAVRQALHHATEVTLTEVNSVTDNPIVFEDGRTISGGLFHGEPIAVVLDYLSIALAELGGISERRVFLLLSGHDGLPPFLIKDAGLNSGLMVPQYTAAALVSENKVLSSPASVDSIPTSLGQEDHVSMGATAATKAWRICDNVETILAIEHFCAAQALDFRAPLEPGVGPRLALRLVRERITHADADRIYGNDVQESLTLLRSRQIVGQVERELGALA